MEIIELKSIITACQLDELSPDDRELVSLAIEATNRSYAPYSRFSVGAALRLENGVLMQGCNQENAASPVGLCAERTALFAAGTQYPDVPVTALAIAARTANGDLQSEPISPCGSCRQAIIETEKRFGHPVRLLLYGEKKVYVVDGISHLMPLSFTEY